MSNKYYIRLNSWFLFLGMLIISILALLKRKKIRINDNNECINPEKAPIKSLAIARIYKHCKKIGFDENLTKIFIAHSSIESGNYTSNIYKTCNNLVGMGRVYTRKTKQCGFKDFGKRVDEPRYMGQYHIIESCIDDWVLWWNFHGYDIRRLNIYNIRDLLTIMKKYKYYILDKNEYIAIVKSVYDTL